MKINIRTLKQEKYEVDIEPSYTILKVKEILEEIHKFEKSSQTLIYAGKILPDDKTIQQCNIGPDDFLVLMIKRKPAAAAAEKPATSEKAAPAASTPAPTPSTATPAAQPSGETPDSQANELLTGPELEKAITNIIEMGFTRERAVEALKVTFNNPARAIEYLTEGGGGGGPVPTPTAPRPTISSPSQSTPARTAAPSGSGGAVPTGAGVFDGLRQHPQFPQLCQLVQTGGEEALKQVLTYFAQTSRPLLELIMANKDEFLRVLSTPVGGAPGGAGGQSPVGPNIIRVQITPDDERVINNLVGMGFERNRVLEAYFLFEKDETLTANYLLNNPDSEDQGGGDTGSQ